MLLSWDVSIQIDIILIETLGVNIEKENKCRDVLKNNAYTFRCKCDYQNNEMYIHNNANY